MTSYVLFVVGGRQKAIATVARSDREIREEACKVGRNPKAKWVEIHHFREGILTFMDKIIP